MAYTGKNYLDLTGLTRYDELIKNYIDTEDVKSLKFAKMDHDLNYILLYKNKAVTEENASEEEYNAEKNPYGYNFKLPVGGASLKALIQSLGTAAGATLNTATNTYSVTLTGNISSKDNIVAGLNLLDEYVGNLGSLTTTDKRSIVAAINSIVTAIAGLNVDEFALTENNNDVISIYGIKEEAGKIAKGTSKIDLKKVAKTGAAEDVSTTAIDDGDPTKPQPRYAAGNVQETLTSIARDLNALESSSVVTVEKLATAESGYIASYAVKQNGTQVGATINIPKDYLVKSASVKVVTKAGEPYPGAEVGDKYIDFVVNTVDTDKGSGDESHIYLPVNDLMSAISGGKTTVANEYELQVSVSNKNVITATLNNIYGKKVLYTPASKTTKLPGVTEVAGALDAIDTLIQGMHADIDADAPATGADENAIGVVSGVTEVDGVLTAVDTAYADAAGSATAAYNAIGSIPKASINALFSKS